MKSIMRSLSLFMAFIMCISLLPVSAFAEDEPAAESTVCEHVHEYIFTEATDTKIAHYVCSGCGGLFLLTDDGYSEVSEEDLAVSNEIPVEESIIPEPAAEAEVEEELPFESETAGAQSSGDNILTSENFPDANFLACLVAKYPSGLTAAEAASETSLKVASKGIENLQGIGFFTGLENLNCSSNSLTSLNVSANTSLKILYCYSNSISSLDVSGHTALTELDCGSSSLTELNVSGCSALKELYCTDSTALTELDCSRLSLTKLGVSGCTGLSLLDCSNNSLTNLFISTCTALTELDCSNNSLTYLYADSCTALKRLDCSNNSIIPLDVSGCTVLEDLCCSGNSVHSLNVSNCTALKKLVCCDNDLVEYGLSVTTCTGLTTLDCSKNSIASLDLSKNTALKYLNCSENCLTSLDVGNCRALEDLNCAQCRLTYLDVSANTKLTGLGCGSQTSPGFTGWASSAERANAGTVDYNGSGTLPSFSVFYAVTTSIITEYNFPDANFLADLDMSYPNGLTAAQAATEVTEISLSGLKISDLTGIKLFTGLETLACNYMTIPVLDVSGLTSLKTIYCDKCGMTSLNVSGCTALESLYCNGNSLTSLDVSSLTALTMLGCNGNGLTSLNVSGCAALESLYCKANSLTSLDVSGLSALATLDCSTNSLYLLNVSGLSALTMLNCNGNGLTSLNVSGCTALESLYCNTNNLTSLDVSGLTALATFDCSANSLASLNAAGCTGLESLYCYDNSIASLNVNGCTALTVLIGRNNSLTSLNIADCTALEELNCSKNSLTYLDLSKNTVLTRLNCTEQNFIGFRGWASSPEKAAEGNADYDGSTGLPGFTELYATIIPISYTITFHANGGTGKMANISAKSGTSYTLTANAFKKTGYSFAGWNTCANGDGTEYADMASVKDLCTQDRSTIVLYAQWLPNTYTVVFDPNGGAGVMEAMPFKYGTAQDLTLCAFTKAGYTFTGWQLGSKVYMDGQSVINLTSENNATITLVAQWKANTSYEGYNYQIVFDGNGSTGGKTPAEPMKVGTAKALTANGFTKTGYHFIGWAVTANGEAVYANKQSVKDLSIAFEENPVKLFAVWEANTYTVTFNGNGGKSGTAASYTQGMTFDESAGLIEKQFVRKGYSFKEWNTKKDGKGISYADKAEVINLTAANKGKFTLYAIWTANTYIIRYDKGDGTGGEMSEQTAVYNKTVKLSANAFRYPGYSFAGWSAGGDGTVSYKDKASVKNLRDGQNAEITLTAVWKANTYTVKFNANGGKGTVPATVTAVGTEPVPIPQPDARGMDFAGYHFREWNTKADGTGTGYQPEQAAVVFDTKDKAIVTLYAIWTYEVTFFAGTGYGEPITEYEMVYNRTAAVQPELFTKTGYYLAGWNKSEAAAAKGSVQYRADAVKNVGLNSKLYAVWKPCAYTIRFDANGGTGKMNVLPMTFNTAKALTANAFKNPGHTFLGWSTDPNADEAAFANKAKIKDELVPENDRQILTLYAVWS